MFRSLLVALALGLALTTAPPTDAANRPVSLVKSFSARTVGSNPGQIVVAGNVGYFAAAPSGRDDQGIWHELYRTDGTEAGTRLVKDLLPGDDEGANPSNLTALGSTLFFQTGSRKLQSNLWQTDGTEAGTVPITLGPFPGQRWNAQILGVHAGELIVLAAAEDANYNQIEQSVWAVRPGIAPRRAATVPVRLGSSFALLGNGRIVFVRYSFGQPEPELWTTSVSGDEAHRIGASAGLKSASILSVSGDQAYFRGETTATGTELWATDGTETGTKAVLDATPSPASKQPSEVATTNGTLYLSTLFPSALIGIRDGAPLELRPEAGTATGFDARRLTALGSKLCFVEGTDNDLWCTDGTQAGTAKLYDHETGGPVRHVALLGDTLYFSVDSAIWQTDGTAAGTRVFSTAPAATYLTENNGMARLGNALLFAATDEHGRELWRADGTPGGTKLVRDIATKPTGNNIQALATLRGRALFAVADDFGKGGLWTSDGSRRGTRLLQPLPAGIGPRDVVRVGRLVVFQLPRFGDAGSEVWQTDGTAKGTRRVSTPEGSPAGDGGSVRIGRRILRHWHAGSKGYAITAQDVTTGRWTTLHRLPRKSGESPQWSFALVATRRAVYFQGYDAKGGFALWRTDGTARGTRRVRASSAQDESAVPLAATGNRVLFTTDENWGEEPYESHEQQLWSSTGSARGTRRVGTVTTPSMIGDRSDGNAKPRPAAIPGPAGTVLYTSVVDDQPQLWSSDGTRRGTRRLAAKIGGDALEPGVQLGNRLWFTNSSVLWSTGGTRSTTRKVKGPDGYFSAYRLAGRGRTLLFTSPEDWELWRLRSPRGKPRRLADLWPGAGSSFPDNFMFASGKVLFSADDGTSGTQLFGMKLPK